MEIRGKSPANPSRTATAKVSNPLPVPEHCPNCGSPVGLVENDAIYGTHYGEWPWAYRCTDDVCDSHVGLHPFTSIPLGTLADAPTRAARREAKQIFNLTWRREMTRTEAYKWLAGRLGIANSEECHIGWFSVEQCAQVVEVCRNHPRSKHAN